ncbi:MAG: hypothetical protein GEV04_23700, partial [Actinophytocola sp.]|nr:hypothetical protein [Actinophytocola sp.]
MESSPGLGTSRRFEAFAAEAARAGEHDGQAAQDSPLALVGSDPPQERRERIEQYLIGKVARVLGSAPERIDPDRPLTELGFDSLMAVELTSAIKTDLGVQLPVVKVLEGGSSRDLARAAGDLVLVDETASEPADDVPAEAAVESAQPAGTTSAEYLLS